MHRLSACRSRFLTIPPLYPFFQPKLTSNISGRSECGPCCIPVGSVKPDHSSAGMSSSADTQSDKNQIYSTHIFKAKTYRYKRRRAQVERGSWNKGLHKGNVTEYDPACSDVNGEQGERSWEGLGSSILNSLNGAIDQRDGVAFSAA